MFHISNNSNTIFKHNRIKNFKPNKRIQKRLPEAMAIEKGKVKKLNSTYTQGKCFPCIKNTKTLFKANAIGINIHETTNRNDLQYIQST